MKVFNSKSIMMMVLVVLVISLVSLFYPTEHIEAESDTAGRIAYVDLWTIFNYHPEKVNAEVELNQLAQSMQAELEEKAKGLPKDEQQELLKEYQGKLSQREQVLIQDIIDHIKEVIIDLAQEKELKMVLDKSNVIYGGYDMTEVVINYIKEEREEVESQEPVVDNQAEDSSLEEDLSENSNNNQ